MTGEVRYCECCGTASLAGRHGRARYCLACRNEGKIGQGRILALRAVNTKVRAGDMPRADSFLCVDCGDPAQGWEHRDYSRPFDVEPVCRHCNAKRGPAKNNFHIPPATLVGALAFFVVGLLSHDCSLFRSPDFSHANACESVIKVRALSER